MDRQAKIAELEQLRIRTAELESEIVVGSHGDWAPESYYTVYHILAGMVLGLIASSASLLFNIVGAVMMGEHPLQLIRVYLTFPLGEKALSLDSGFALAAGCCLYLGTGMFGGIPFHMILSRYFPDAPLLKRFIVATILGLGVWVINFYGLIYWLQPMLIDGRRWIVEQVPVVVAIFTHLVFAWTILLANQWGRFVPPAHAGEESKV